MHISIIQNEKEIRQRFLEKFVMPWEKFKRKRFEWIQRMENRNYTVTPERLYLWDRMEYSSISFGRALDLLRSLGGDAYFMSKDKNKLNCCGTWVDGVERKSGVARANAADLADRIAYEWYEDWRLGPQNMDLADAIFPEDL